MNTIDEFNTLYRNPTDSEDWTPLRYAVAEGNTQVVRGLLEKVYEQAGGGEQGDIALDEEANKNLANDYGTISHPRGAVPLLTEAIIMGAPAEASTSTSTRT